MPGEATKKTIRKTYRFPYDFKKHFFENFFFFKIVRKSGGFPYLFQKKKFHEKVQSQNRKEKWVFSLLFFDRNRLRDNKKSVG